MRAQQPKQSEQRIKIPRAIEGLKVHPAAAVFPTMTEQRFLELRASLREHGYDTTQPIVVHEGQILDGRHRAYAAKLEGIEPLAIEWKGQRGSPASFAAGTNLQRRDLTPSERAAIAVELLPIFEAEAKARQTEAARANAAAGGHAKAANDEVLPSSPAGDQGRKPAELSSAKAAEEAETSPRSVQRAKRVKDRAPDLFEAVRTNGLSLGAAERELKRREQAEPEPAANTKPDPSQQIAREVNAFVERLHAKYHEHRGVIAEALRNAIRERLW